MTKIQKKTLQQNKMKMKTKYKNINQFKTLIKTSNDTKRENSFLHCSNKKIQDENVLNCHNRLSRNV